jgi:uroporphyrinogen-III synthase
MKEYLRILYTGTRPIDQKPDSVEIRHLPMLTVDLLDLSHARLQSIFAAGRVHYVFFSSNAVAAAVANGLFSGRLPSPTRCWTVGPKTSATLRQHTSNLPITESTHGNGDSTVDLIRSNGPLDVTYIAFEVEDAPLPLEHRLPPPFQAVSIAAYTTVGRPIPDLQAILAEFCPHWIVLTSPRGVDAFHQNLISERQEGSDASHQVRHPPPNAQIAVLGQTTANHVASMGWTVDHIASKPDLEFLFDELHPGIDCEG